MMKNGWIIVEKHKNGAETPCTPCLNEKGKYDGISGFGELFYCKKNAQEAIDDMDGENWLPPLEIRRAILNWKPKR